MKVTSYVNFSHNLTFEVQTIWKILLFQYYWWKYWNTEKLLNFEKFQLKWKIVKLFKRPKQTATFRNLFSLRLSPCHQIKSYYVFKTKIFLGRYTKIYRNLLSKYFRKVVLGSQKMVQCKYFFWHQTEACLLENL